MANLFPCPSCGGQLIYDVKSHQMKCQSCGSFFPIDEYKSQEFDYTREVVTCPNCGGEVAAPSLDGMNFCPYCGAEMANAEHFSQRGYPDKIIPFALSKQDCIDRYQRMVDGVPFLPDDLKTSDGLESFVGLYTPYWIYNYEAKGRVSVPIAKDESDAMYDYHYTADMETDLDCEISVGQDASQTLDDTVSEQIEPFFYEKVRDFNPNYMAGFYAENSTVDPDIYDDVTKTRCVDIIRKKLDMMAGDHDGYYLSESSDAQQREISPYVSKAGENTGAYLPLWFLTTRKNNRVAYTVVNGQTGAAHADLPVDIGKYVRGSLVASAICAVILLLIFGAFGTIDMHAVPFVTLIFSSVLMIVASFQSNHIYRKENHIDDAGFSGSKSRKKPKDPYETDHRKKGSLSANATSIVIFVIFAFFAMSSLAIGTLFRCIPIIIFVVAVIIMIVKARGSSSFTAVLAMTGAMLSLADLILDPHSDVFMYGLVIANIVIMIIVALQLARDYNRIATQPLPQFRKKGGNLNGKY